MLLVFHENVFILVGCLDHPVFAHVFKISKSVSYRNLPAYFKVLDFQNKSPILIYLYLHHIVCFTTTIKLQTLAGALCVKCLQKMSLPCLQKWMIIKLKMKFVKFCLEGTKFLHVRLLISSEYVLSVTLIM